MSPEDRVRALVVLGQIRADVQGDVARFEGSPIQAIGAWMGGLSAAVDALAGILAKVIAEGDTR